MRPVKDYQDVLPVGVLPLVVGLGHMPDDEVLPVILFHQDEGKMRGRGPGPLVREKYAESVVPDEVVNAFLVRLGVQVWNVHGELPLREATLSAGIGARRVASHS